MVKEQVSEHTTLLFTSIILHYILSQLPLVDIPELKSVNDDSTSSFLSFHKRYTHNVDGTVLSFAILEFELSPIFTSNSVKI